MMLLLQEQGCHNINFVTPEHVVAQILEALPLAIEGGLRLPLVYNTSAYDSLHSIELMDGLVDIYMPDFKFWDSEMARHYSKARNYPEAARQVIKAMHQQVGDLVLDENGLALRGVILRHLVMPGSIAGTREIMDWAALTISATTRVPELAKTPVTRRAMSKEVICSFFTASPSPSIGAKESKTSQVVFSP